jgi:hypothetical protein
MLVEAWRSMGELDMAVMRYVRRTWDRGRVARTLFCGSDGALVDVLYRSGRGVEAGRATSLGELECSFRLEEMYRCCVVAGDAARQTYAVCLARPAESRKELSTRRQLAVGGILLEWRALKKKQGKSR